MLDRVHMFSRGLVLSVLSDTYFRRMVGTMVFVCFLLGDPPAVPRTEAGIAGIEDSNQIPIHRALELPSFTSPLF